MDLLQAGESQLAQTPVAFDTPFFSRINIEKLTRPLKEKYNWMQLKNNKRINWIVIKMDDKTKEIVYQKERIDKLVKLYAKSFNKQSFLVLLLKFHLS